MKIILMERLFVKILADFNSWTFRNTDEQHLPNYHI